MRVIKFCIILLIVYSLIALQTYKFDNWVDLSGDGWEYQTLAVNFAKGHGLMKIGTLAGDYHQDYKFYQEINEIYQPALKKLEEWAEHGGKFNFYRAPGYIVFLGGIYKIFGVNPEIVKIIQLLLIATTAAFLPYIGFYYWEKKGLVSGLFGGAVYFKEYGLGPFKNSALTYPDQIMAEGLVAFGLFVLIFAWIYWEKQKTPKRTWLLGIIAGINLLIKGANIFIPMLIIIYFGYLLAQKRMNKLSLVAFVFGLVITILPWSIYASKKSGQLIILSTQGENALLDNNNEYAVDGGWHPEGYSSNPNSFYRQPEIESLSLPAKLLMFYVSHPEMIIKTFLAKISFGFKDYIYLRMALLLIGFQLFSQIMIEFFKKFNVKILFRATAVIGMVMCLLLVNVFKNEPYFYLKTDRLVKINNLLLGVFVLLIMNILIRKKPIEIGLPISFLILFLNYLFLTITLLGWPRLIQVVDFIFILVFFKFLFDLIIQVFNGSVKHA